MLCSRLDSRYHVVHPKCDILTLRAHF
jgi:hypothetical protein